MAILSTIVKDFIRYKKEGGYITLKPKTDADCVSYINSDAVETDVQTELDEINNNLSDLLKVQTFKREGTFSQYSNYSIPITCPDGYKILCTSRISTNGFVAPIYVSGYTNTYVDCWLVNGSGSGSIDCDVIFIKNY